MVNIGEVIVKEDTVDARYAIHTKRDSRLQKVVVIYFEINFIQGSGDFMSEFDQHPFCRIKLISK